jgi:hypothetical protein
MIGEGGICSRADHGPLTLTEDYFVYHSVAAVPLAYGEAKKGKAARG